MASTRQTAIAAGAGFNAARNRSTNKEFILAAVAVGDPRALEPADESLKKDKEFVLAAVARNGLALKYADESLEKDKEFVLTAVVKNGYLWSTTLKKDTFSP